MQNWEWAFVGDTLFNYGCGRVMEGSYEQMFQSLKQLKALPADTLIYCGHEYTVNNLNFCSGRDSKFKVALQQAEETRARKEFTVPFRLGDQINDSPFLSDSFEEFSEWRDARNAF